MNKKYIKLINDYVNFYFGECKIFYQIYGSLDDSVNIFLHGWGQNGTSFDRIIKQVGGNWLLIDFPPFGSSDEPKNWNIYSYANMLISLCEHLKIEHCNFIGHSFGGRIAILISALRPDLVNKLMLIDSAGLKPKRKISYYMNVISFKILKFFGYFPQNAGSSDYCNLSKNMKPTFISIVNTPLEEYCSQIEAETTIVFGENDEETPVYMAKKLHKLIKKSQLYIIDGAGHFVFIDREIAFVKILKQFLEAK